MDAASNVIQLVAIPPEPATAEQLDAIEREVLANIEADFKDPLSSLSDASFELLRSVAYHDAWQLDQFERRIQAAMRAKPATYSETTVARFTLNRVRDAAKQLAKQVKLRERAMQSRNAETDPDDTQPTREITTNDKMMSMSPFLRAQGMLEYHHGSHIWHDAFYQRDYATWDGITMDDAKTCEQIEINDDWLIKCHTWLHYNDPLVLIKSSDTNTAKAIRAVALMNTKNAAQDWLNSLVWDGTPRLKTWLKDTYNVEESNYYERVGINWFVSMVARVMKPGCQVDTMPVLLGDEGIGKSRSLEIIGGDWYASVSTSLSRKPEDFKQALLGKVIIEVAEMQSFTRAENTQIKELLSTAVDRVRFAYGRGIGDYPRTCVMVSTTNDMEWHTEETGYRRFWPINCVGEVQQEWLRQNIAQLWAEAVALYKAGASWHGREIADEQRELVKEHTSGDPWEEMISDWLAAVEQRSYTGPGCGVELDYGDPIAQDMNANWGTAITSRRLLTVVLQVPVSNSSKGLSARLARIMNKLGWQKRKAGTKLHRVWVWERREISPTEILGNSET